VHTTYTHKTLLMRHTMAQRNQQYEARHNAPLWC